MIIFYLLIFLTLFYVIFWHFSLLIATILGSPIVYADDRAILDAFKFADLKTDELVIDLGCGSAKSLMLAAKKFGARGLGVERSPYCFLLAKLRLFFYEQKGRVKIVFGDFRAIEKEIGQADVIYLYLLNETLAEIEDWLFAHIAKKTKVVSLAFSFPKHKPFLISQTNNLTKKTNLRLYYPSNSNHKSEIKSS